MSSSLDKHIELLPAILDFIRKPVSATPDIENNLEGEILDYLYTQVEDLDDEVQEFLTDINVSTCRDARIYDYFGSLLGIKPVYQIQEDKYPIFIAAIWKAINKGPTKNAMTEALEAMFTDVLISEMFTVTSDPTQRKIFRVSINLFESTVFDSLIDGLNFTYLVLDLLKPVTSDYYVDNVLNDEFDPISDNTDPVSFVIDFPATGPLLIDPTQTQYETLPWTGDVFFKNNFLNSSNLKNNFDVRYQDLFTDGDFDSPTIVLT